MNNIPARELAIREIIYGSIEYETAVALRAAILRQPLGLKFTPEQLQAEQNQHHIACYYQGNLAACLVLKPGLAHTIVMRQVAVTPALQGKGIGKALIKFAEEFALQHHYSAIILHARATAIPFYEKQGYKCRGKFFEEISLPHREMYKKLLAS